MIGCDRPPHGVKPSSGQTDPAKSSASEKRAKPKLLHRAARDTDLKVLKELLAEGVSPNAKEAVDGFGNTALHMACAQFNDEVGINAIFGAFTDLPVEQKVEVVELLLSHGANVHALNVSNQTPFHVAVGVGAAPGNVIQMLIDHGVEVNQQDGLGISPLHSASYGGQIDIVKQLLSHGADLRVIAGSSGWTPLGSIIGNGDFRSGQLGVATFLLDQGASAKETDRNGLSMLHWVADAGNLQFLNLFLKHGAQVNATGAWEYADPHIHSTHGSTVMSGDGYTPLHISAWHNDVEAAQILIDHGAHVDVKAGDGATALHLAASLYKIKTAVRRYRMALLRKRRSEGRGGDSSGLEEGLVAKEQEQQQLGAAMVDLLVAHGADVNAKDNTGYPVLHWAIGYRRLPGGPLVAGELMADASVVRALVSHGVDYAATDAGGKSASQLAGEGGGFLGKLFK